MRLLVDSAARNPLLSATSLPSSDIKYEYTFSEVTRNIKCLRLLSALVPHSYYAVQAGWSQVFEYTSNAVYRTVALPEGTYDGETLKDELNAGFAANGDSLLVASYDEKNNKITLTNGIATTVIVGSQGIGLSTAVPYPGVRRILGMTSAAPVTILTTASYTFLGMVDMSAPQYLYLTVSSGSANNSSGIRDWFTRRQFVIPMGDAPYLAFRQMDINETFSQGDLVDNQQFQKILIEWATGVPNVTALGSGGAEAVRAYPLAFNGVDHTLVFETS